MREVDYVVRLGEDARRRHYHETERGRVVRFVVQLEVKAKGGWHMVLRYDCSHGFAHRDRYNLKGEQIKEALSGSYEEVLTLADGDIKKAWREYKERFLEGGYP